MHTEKALKEQTVRLRQRGARTAWRRASLVNPLGPFAIISIAALLRLGDTVVVAVTLLNPLRAISRITSCSRS